MPQPDAIVHCARGWLGTPYHHQGSVRGAGCDCLGLIRGVWRALYGPEPEVLPPYSRDWGDGCGSETLIAAACRHLVPLGGAADARAGDVLVFRMRDKGVAKHAGILVTNLLDQGMRLSAWDDDAHGSSPGRHPEVRATRASKDGRAPHYDAQNDAPHMIHAQEGLGVVEVPLGVWWRRRAVAAFRFPDNE